MPNEAEPLIRLFTIASLGGLLFSVGLRLRLPEVVFALQTCRMARIVLVNFIVVPLIAWILARVLQIAPEQSVALLLLAAAPFAPVVPVFVKMAGGNLALAAGLTAVFPLLSAFITPLVFQVSLAGLPGMEMLHFSLARILSVLFATITFPLLAGMLLRYAVPGVAQALLRPIEIAAEAIGALSLAFVALVEWDSILVAGWKPLLAMALTCELSFIVGHVAEWPAIANKTVSAFGAGNRNIALALLIGVDSFAGTPIVAAVAADGLLIIFLGLLHVAYYRFLQPCGDPR